MPALIRLATTADAAAFAAIYSDVIDNSAISFELVPPTTEEMAARITDVVQHAPWLTYELDGKVLGYTYAAKHRERAAYLWSVDASVYIRDDHRGRGIGRKLYTALFALLRIQGFYAVHAGITLPNAGSVALHEALGFQPIGIYRAVGFKLGQWHDVGWYQLELRPRTGKPTAPLALSVAMQQPGWREALGLSGGG